MIPDGLEGDVMNQVVSHSVGLEETSVGEMAEVLHSEAGQPGPTEWTELLLNLLALS